MLRVGLIGAGWVAGRHLDAWRALADRATVVAIADPSAAARSARAAEYGIPAAYADAAAMLANEGLDAVDIAAPREWHVAHVRLAAAAGLAILCQKPLAPSYAEAAALVVEVGDRVPFMVHENWRFRPHYRQIGRWLDEHRIGRPVLIAMSLVTSGLVPDADGRLPALVRQPMLTKLRQMLVKEILIHHIDTLRFLLGEMDLVTATVGRLSEAVAGDDHAQLVMNTQHGAPVVLTGTLHGHGYPAEAFDRLEIFGADGRILLERDRLGVDAATSDAVALDLAADYAQSYRDAIGCFVDGVTSGALAENSARDNLRTLRLVDEAYAASGFAAG